MAYKEKGNAFSPGDLIFSEKPFVFVLFHRLTNELCDLCFNKLKTSKACSRCLYVRYCDETCQRTAWPEHKRECKSLRNLPNHDADIIRLLGKVLIKLKTDKNSLQEQMFSNLKCSVELISKEEEVTLVERGKLVFLYLVASNCLPLEKDMFGITLRVHQNKFWIHNRIRPEGYAIYLGASVIRHACIPNAVCAFKGSKIEIRAIEKIADGDKLENVTVAYFPLLNGYHDEECGHDFEVVEYQRFLSQCKCRDCSAPLNDSVLRKLLNSERAQEVILKSIACSTLALRSKFVASPHMMTVLHHVLAVQKGVLAKTHIFRLRTLALEILFNVNKPDIVLRKGAKLLKVIKKAFGEKSPELIWLYDVLSFASKISGDDDGSLKYDEVMRNLCKMYGYEGQVSLLEYGTPTGPSLDMLASLLFNQLRFV